MENWKIEIEKLEGPDRAKWAWLTDEFYINKENSFACLVYSIAETSMGWYTGKLAIFENRENPSLTFDTSTINCDGIKEHVVYFDKGRKAVIRTKVYDKKLNAIYIPFLIIDIQARLFTYIAIVNGCHYRLNEINNDSIQLIEIYKENNFPSHDNEIINVTSMKWNSVSNLDKYNKMIIEEFRNRKNSEQ